MGVGVAIGACCNGCNATTKEARGMIVGAGHASGGVGRMAE